MAQSVEHVIGNDEVISSILISSSKNQQPIRVADFFLCGVYLLKKTVSFETVFFYNLLRVSTASDEQMHFPFS